MQLVWFIDDVLWPRAILCRLLLPHELKVKNVDLYGSVTLVLLPLKYEIDDSVTVTVVLLGEAGRCCIRLWAGHRPTGKTEID